MPEHAINFFDEAKVRSLYKLELWEKYLTPYGRKLGSRVGPGKKYRHLWIIDGFAGAGRYRPAEGGAVQDGSPVIAAKWAQALREERGCLMARCVNVERDKDCFAELEASTADWRSITTNLPGEFSERVEGILEMIGEDPALFLLDPFGVNGTPMDVLVRILRRPGKTEILSHFSDKTFLRMAGHLDENLERTPLGQKLAASKLETLDGLLGTPMWRRLWTENVANLEGAIDSTVNLYLAELRQRVKYAHQIRIRDHHHRRAAYRLVFCTNSPHGVELMSDLACRYERGLERADRGLTLWAEQETPARMAELRDAIQAYGLARGQASRREIVHALVPARFGVYTTPDYARRIRELVTDKAIDRPTSKGIKEQEQLRFIRPDQGSLLGPTAI